MSSNRRIRRDDFDIESIERFEDSKIKSRTSGSRTRSRSRKRSSCSRRLDNGSRSRSRSVESRRKRRDRNTRSRSRSGSRRSHGRRHSRRSDRRHTSRKHRDSRSRSNSRSRSKSKSYSRQRSGRYRNDNDDIDREQYRRKSSKSRSRSRSSSHFRDFPVHDTKNECDTSSNPSTSSALLTKIQEEHTPTKDSNDDLANLPLPKQKSTDKKSKGESYQIGDNVEDRARIHREIEEKLRATLAKEGKVYPPPKAEASHPVFANDGSFLEIFKQMQQASTSPAASTSANPIISTVPSIAATAKPSTAPYLAAAATGKSAPPPPLVGRRRGGKILKTGVVAKPKMQTDANTDPKDFWAIYLAEVNKYKNTACETEQGNRPLVK